MSKISIKPLADRVLILPLDAETKTASGIYIPDSAKEKPQKGTVKAVGPKHQIRLFNGWGRCFNFNV